MQPILQRIQSILLRLRKSHWLRSNGPSFARCVCVVKRKNRGCHRGFFCLLIERHYSEMPRVRLDHLYAFLVLSHHYPEAVAARGRVGRQASSGEGRLISLINHLTANQGEQDRRIQDVLLWDCNQILIEDCEICQLPNLD